MANQPIKNTKDYQKYISKETENLLTNVSNSLIDIFSVEKIITPELFLLSALESDDSMLYKTVNSFINDNTMEQIHDKIVSLITNKETNISYTVVSNKVEWSQDFTDIVYKSNIERKGLKHPVITSDHILLAILNLSLKECPIKQFFENEGLTYNILKGISSEMHDINQTLINIPQKNDKPIIENKISTNIQQYNNDNNDVSYCLNLNKEVKRGKIDKIVGRDNELSKIIKVLNRKTCNNVLLVGDNGVGKTSIIEGLAYNIVNKLTIDDFTSSATIFKLKANELLGGTQYRGVIEEHVSYIKKSLSNIKNSILFIDDIHILMSHNRKENFDFGSLLNDIFADNNIHVIATTTSNKFRECLEIEGNINSNFQRINIDKPSNDECLEILKYLCNKFENFHNVTYPENILPLIITLANRYVTSKTLPSSAIDIMDEAGVNVKINNIDEDIKTLNISLSKLLSEKDLYIRKSQFEKSNEIQKKIDDIIVKLTEKKYDLVKTCVVTEQDIYKAVADNTDIPLNKISSDEKKSIANIDKTLKSIIIGQDNAIDLISKAIKRSKVGLFPSNRPLGSFMCIGGTGCGKTLMAKTLAKEIFGDEKYLVRLDMSEYTDKTSANKLIGASAGYVGYEQGGVLTEAVKNKKYAVLLIDEIEKAHEDIFNFFLQILDEGYLTDNTGIKVDFKNTIIILTSNIGAKEASITNSLGFNQNNEDAKNSVIEKELKNKFAPEFLNRLDEIIYFNKLTDENLKTIISLEMNKLKERIEQLKFNLDFDNTAIEYIFQIISKNKEYGARPIIRAIQNEYENYITDLILENDYSTHTFKIRYNDNKLLID